MIIFVSAYCVFNYIYMGKYEQNYWVCGYVENVYFILDDYGKDIWGDYSIPSVCGGN